jgi:hypothetical protein
LYNAEFAFDKSNFVRQPSNQVSRWPFGHMGTIWKANLGLGNPFGTTEISRHIRR